MIRYAVLVKFTEKGIAEVKNSPSRADSIVKRITQMGGKLETVLWTLGEYDGILLFTAPDDVTAAALMLDVGRQGFVRTTMLRAFNEEEFKGLLSKLS